MKVDDDYYQKMPKFRLFLSSDSDARYLSSMLPIQNRIIYRIGLCFRPQFLHVPEDIATVEHVLIPIFVRRDGYRYIFTCDHPKYAHLFPISRQSRAHCSLSRSVRTALRSLQTSLEDLHDVHILKS